jgi:hypothetical protein
LEPHLREAETVEQQSNEMETSAAPGVGLVIGTELVNPDPVSNTFYILIVILRTSCLSVESMNLINC